MYVDIYVIIHIYESRRKSSVLQECFSLLHITPDSRGENLDLLYMSEKVKNTFRPGPMVFFRSAWKFSSCLFRAKLYPLEKTVGSWYISS